MGKSNKEAAAMFERMTPVVERVTDSNEESLYDMPMSSMGAPSKKQRKQSKDTLSVKPKEITKKPTQKQPKEKKKSKKIIQKEPEEVLALFKDTHRPEEEEQEAQLGVQANKEAEQLLASVVMVGGLLLIAYGVYKIYQGKSAPTPVKTEDFVL